MYFTRDIISSVVGIARTNRSNVVDIAMDSALVVYSADIRALSSSPMFQQLMNMQLRVVS